MKLRMLIPLLLLAVLPAFGKHKAEEAGKLVKPAKESGANSDADNLFKGSEVLHVKIEISGKGMETLGKYHWNMGQQQDREKVEVTIREGNNVYTNVTAQLKGAAGSFRSIEDKPAFTLNFGKNVKGQRFHGLDKLSLNNSVQDPAYLSEQFSRELFLQSGVPVPRAAHARVELNGRDLGLYVLVEGWDKEFLKSHFKNAKGNLYDGGFLKDVTDDLTASSGENAKDSADLRALAGAAREPDLAKRADRLSKVLDIERFISFLAVDVMLWDWDGYPMNRNNWRLYHDPESDKFVFMPHGLDQMLWKPEGSIFPPFHGMVASALVEIPEFRARYFVRMKELRRTLFIVNALTNRVREIAAIAKSGLPDSSPADMRLYDKTVADFCAAITQRAVSIDRQLATPIEPLKFDASGAAAVVSWAPATNFGRPTFSQPAAECPKGALAIAAKAGSSIGSWGASVWLERGRYRLEGKVKTQGLASDPGDTRGGAGFRAGNSRQDKYILGDSDWKTIGMEVRVGEPLVETRLACEFRGIDGEALFDLGSIRLVRLPANPPNGQ